MISWRWNLARNLFATLARAAAQSAGPEFAVLRAMSSKRSSPLPEPPLERLLLARIEAALKTAVDRATGPGCPPRLAQALRAAVFPGGARLRPQLCVLSALACGDAHPALAEKAACALELLHCASLVHDDLPCFDDAATRRGKPSIHRAFGEPLAVLAGDALIVAAFDVLAQAAAWTPARASDLLVMLAKAAGPARGIVAGQAWESEPSIPIEEYHRAKTGALFEAATTMGAVAGGGDPAAWRRLGGLLGCAYQAADDLRDVMAGEAEIGKPTGRDALLGRPNLANACGVEATRARVVALVAEAMAAVPEGSARPLVRGWIERLARRLAGPPASDAYQKGA
jgi:geranylgeranyl diphosphate synthase type II